MTKKETNLTREVLVELDTLIKKCHEACSLLDIFDTRHKQLLITTFKNLGKGIEELGTWYKDKEPT